MYLYKIQQRFHKLLEIYKNELAEPGDKQPLVMQNAVAFINKHMFDQRLTVQWMEEYFCINAEPLPGLLTFKRYLGQTSKQYWTEHRIEAAKVLLKDDVLVEAPIGDIAFNLGYGTHAAFSIAFKNHTGYSPKAFRDREIELSEEERNEVKA